jgi:uncharacterized protein YegL
MNEWEKYMTLKSFSPVDTDITTTRYIVVLIIDASGSVEDYLNQINARIAGFFEGIRNFPLAAVAFEVSIIAFSGGVRMIRDFGLIGPTDQPPRIEAAEGMSPIGESLMEAIHLITIRKEAVKAALNPENKKIKFSYKKLAVLISDFQDNGSSYTAAVQLLKSLRHKDVESGKETTTLGMLSFGIGDLNQSLFGQIPGDKFTAASVVEFGRILATQFELIVNSVSATPATLRYDQGIVSGADSELYKVDETVDESVNDSPYPDSASNPVSAAQISLDGITDDDISDGYLYKD